MKKSKKEVAAFRKRMLTIIGICFVAVVLIVSIILNASISNIYCVEHEIEDDCNGNNSGLCGNAESCTVCGDPVDGLVCNGYILECVWYPLFCGCGKDCTPVLFGCDLCIGRTYEFGDEYSNNNYKIKEAVNGEDFLIYSMVLSQNDARLGDYYDNFDWDEFWNMYSFNNYDDEFTVTVRFENYVPLYFASVEMTVIGEDGTATVSGYSGHTKDMVEQGTVKGGYILQPGEHIVCVDLTVGGFFGAGVGDIERVEYRFRAMTAEKE